MMESFAPRLAACVALLASAGALAAAPVLLVGPERVSEINAERAVPGSAQADLFATLAASVAERAESDIGGGDRSSGNWNYARADLAKEAAWLYALTGDPAWATIALRALKAVHQDPDPDGRLPDSGYGLARATVGVGFAVAYDLCREAWSAADRAYVRGRIESAINAWASFSHTNLSSPWGSNWVGVCHGAEVLLILSLEDRGASRASRLATLRERLVLHVGHLGSSGWGQEGNHYVPYAGQFALPAAIALARVGDPALLDAFRGRNAHHLALHAGFTGANGPDSAQWGVGGTSFSATGWTSFLSAIVPEAERGAWRWFMDRYRGLASTPGPGGRWEPGAGGNVAAMMFYPDDVAATDPIGVRPVMLVDDKGGAWWRSGWTGSGDIIVALGTDTVSHAKAWDESDALQLNLLSHGTKFVGGPGGSRVAAQFSQVLVDGVARANENHVGTLVHAEAWERGGYAIAGGGSKAGGLGLTLMQRHVLVDAGAPGTDAVIAVLDELAAASPKTFTWQLNTQGRPILRGTEAGRPTFVIRGEGESWLKGWVIHPAGSTIAAESPLRFDISGSSATPWVVLATGSGAAPVARVEGAGLDAVVRLAGRTLRHDAVARRLRLEADLSGAPIARIAPTTSRGPAPFTVALDATGSAHGGAGELAFAWDLGDGRTASGPTFEATFTTRGVYPVRLTVTAPGGASDSAVLLVEVTNAAPVARFTATSATGALPLVVTFDARESVDADGHALVHSWDFGDGATGDGAVVQHTYATRGTFYPALTVDDGHGDTGSALGVVVAGNRAPLATITLDRASGPPPLAIVASATGVSDPEGDLVTHAWDFGDGTTASGASASHEYTVAGSYVIELTTTDTEGNVHRTTRTVRVENQPPVARASATRLSGSAPFAFSPSAAGSSDPEGGALSYSWDFGNGMTATGATPSVTYLEPGNHWVVLRATDPQGATGEATLEVTVLDAAGRRPADRLEATGLLPGLRYGMVLLASQDFPDFRALTPEREGILPHVETRLDSPRDLFAYRFAGFLRVDVAGTYRFHYAVRDSLVLKVGNTEVVAERSRFPKTGSATIALLPGWHRIEVQHHFGPADYSDWVPKLELAWSGPGFDERPIPVEHLAWEPGEPEVEFAFSPAPEALTPSRTAVVAPFDVRGGRTFHLPPSGGVLPINFDGRASVDPVGGAVRHLWDFGALGTASGPTASRAFPAGRHVVQLTVVTPDGRRATRGRVLEVLAPPAELNRARHRPARIVASAEDLGTGSLATGAFDGITTIAGKWMAYAQDASIEIHFGEAGRRTPYVVDAFAVTNPDNWNDRDPRRIRLLGSLDGIHWTLLADRDAIDFGGRTEHRLRFPVPNTRAWSSYRFEVFPRNESPQGWITEVHELELLDGGGGEQPVHRPPVAVLEAPVTAVAGEKVVLDASASFDPEHYPIDFHWDFGDGQTEPFGPAVVTRSYPDPGTYAVSVLVRDALGSTVVVRRVVEVVAGANRPPVAIATATPAEAEGPVATVLDASGSYDPDGDALAFHWDLGDGRTATGPVIETKHAAGLHAVVLTVSDSKGARASRPLVLRRRPLDPPTTVSLNFHARNSDLGPLLGHEHAGVIPVPGWNNADTATTSIASLRDHRGDRPGISAAISGSTSIYASGTPATPGTPRMLHQFRGIFSSPAYHEVTLAGIPWARYDLVVYAGSGPAGLTGGTVAVAVGPTTRWMRDTDGLFDGELTESFATSAAEAVDGREYVVFRGLSGPSVTMRVTGSARMGIAGLQVVAGDLGGGGTSQPPLIAAQPTDVFRRLGESASFGVAASGPGTLAYRWQRAGVDLLDDARISGASTATLAITALQADDAGRYRVIVTNEHGSTPSAEAVLGIASAGPLALDEPFPGSTFDAAWQDGTTNVNPIATGLGFSHGGYLADPAIGGGARVSTSTLRGIQRTFLGAGEVGERWVSFLVSPSSTGAGALFVAFHDSASAYSLSNPVGSGVGIGTDGSAWRAAVRGPSTGDTIRLGSGKTLTTGLSYLVVARIVVGPGPDTAEVWVKGASDPLGPSAESMGPADLVVTDADFGSGWRHAWLGGSAATGTIDALRVSAVGGWQGLGDVLGTGLPPPPPLTALETRRLAVFGTVLPAGDAADDADPDRDGVPNLVELALGSHPLERGDRPTMAIEADPASGSGEFLVSIRMPINGIGGLVEGYAIGGVLVQAAASSDLAIWRRGAGEVVVQSVEDHGDGTATVRLRPAGDPVGKGFLRLEATPLL